ncbi:signal peptide protein [Burkholderia contaminans]|uniref:SphA family protein n=1 Tax=Burkholderia contaminans TaxID=488447 RepID=UPI001453F780|nr:transporter [Burkholderia contaminans]VWD35686.1 signal peptide protein [Burkholderia contaminans]
MSTKLTAAVVGCAVLAAGWMNEAGAFEGGVSPYPAGAVGTNMANLPPIPGLFALEQFNYSFANGLYGNDGGKLPIPFHSSVFSETTRLLASYPFHLLGANVYTQLVVPVVSLHTSVLGQKSTQNGLSNITLTPVLLQWSLSRNLAIASGVDLAFETGSYSPVKPSVSVGYLSVQPVFTVRYNVPNGIDLGVSNRLLINQENSTTNYRSGTAYVGEFEAGWNFGRWKVGVVGAYLNQFSDDKQSGVNVGNRTKTFGIGPSIVYDGGAYNINLNYQQGVYAANTAKSSSIWLNVAFPLWASFRPKG